MNNIDFEEMQKNASKKRSELEQTKQLIYKVLDVRPDLILLLITLSDPTAPSSALVSAMINSNDAVMLCRASIRSFLHDYTDRTLAIEQEKREQQESSEGEK